MYELQVKESTNFMGVELPNIIGGFGLNKRSIVDKSIAEIHKMKTIHVREILNRNINRFKKNIDYVDLKVIVQNDNNSELLQSLGYNKMQISKSNNIYLLSERGYAKLIKILDTDLAWEVHDKLIDEYFQMKEIIKDNNQINSTIDSQQINDLITTVTNLASTVNNLVSTMGSLMDATQNSKNKIEFDFKETSHKDELDTIEKEIMNFTEETIRIQNFCDFINDKDIVPKRIGVQLVNQLLRDNGVYNKYNYPEENSPYFIRENTRNLLTKQGMLMLYKLIKDNIDYKYTVRR